jgi:hypothetical protein
MHCGPYDRFDVAAFAERSLSISKEHPMAKKPAPKKTTAKAKPAAKGKGKG